MDFGPLFREVLLSDTRPIPVYETYSDLPHISDVYRNTPDPAQPVATPPPPLPPQMEPDYASEILHNINNMDFNQGPVESDTKPFSFSSDDGQALPDLSDFMQLDDVGW